MPQRPNRLPTLGEIETECEEIQSEWSDEVRLVRAGYAETVDDARDLAFWMPPRVRVSESCRDFMQG